MKPDAIIQEISSLKGKAGFHYLNLKTLASIRYQSDSSYKAASIIKLPMLVVMEKLFYQKKVDPLEEITIKEEEKVGGCGGLSLIPGDVTVNYRGLCNNMIALSDNTATNKLMSTFSIDFFNEEFSALGMQTTRLRRLLYDSEGQKRGLENTFSLEEIVNLLKELYFGNIISRESSKSILDTLLLQQINHKIPAWIPSGIPIAHKTGEDDDITHDIGIVFARTPFVLGFASNKTSVPETENVIRKLSAEIYELAQNS